MPTSGISPRYAGLVIRWRWVIVPAWIILAGAMYFLLPALSSTGSRTGFGGAIVGQSSPAIQAQAKSFRTFAFPLLAETAVVQHKASGLSAATQANTVAKAAELDLHKLAGLTQILGAIPITNTLGIFPSSRQHGTTAVTYLFFNPSLGSSQKAGLTQRYGDQALGGTKAGSVIGSTGAYPAIHSEGNQLSGSLSLVEIAAIVLVLVIVGVAFRGLLAPVINIIAAFIAYFISQRVLEQATLHVGITVPAELDPVIVVLLLGIVTDYSVFFLSGFKDQLVEGHPRALATLRSITQVAPLVLTAGITVASAVAVIATAHLALFAELGPPLAISVTVAFLVSVSFTPACLALFGEATYWPSHPVPAAGEKGHSPSGRFRTWLSAIVVRPKVAIPGLILGVLALVAAASPLAGANVGVNLVSALPASTQVSRAAAAASAGFAPGIIAPTEVLVSGKGVGAKPAALDRLQGLIAKQPGVAGVVGPADKPTSAELGAFVATSGNSARYLVILDHLPYGAPAVADLSGIERHMAGLLSQAGLPQATPAYAGNTALSVGIVNGSDGDLIRVGLFTLAVDLAILIIFLRALVAPVVLIVGSALVVAAALGITTFVFTGPLGTVGFTFYVPFAAEVLLIAFGADYNLYLVGRIWETAPDMSFREAISQAGAEASFAINVAGVTLALTFAILAVVTLGSFQQLALAMAGGLLIDTFFVRSLLVPAALSMLGKRAGWPGPRLKPAQDSEPEKAAA